MDNISQRLIPVLSIRNSVIFPGLALPLRVGREKSVAAVREAMRTGGWLLTLSQRSDDQGQEPTMDALFRVGTLSKIEKIVETEDHGFQAVVRGIARFQVSELLEQSGAIFARGEIAKDLPGTDEKTLATLKDSLKTLGEEILRMLPAETDQLIELLKGVDDLGFLTYLIAANAELPVEKSQELLQTLSLKDRALALLEVLQKQKEQLQVQSEISDKLSRRIGKVQREAILREQLQAIREELGDDETGGKDDYRKRIDEARMPEEVRKVAIDEVKRLEAAGPNSPETQVIRNYLDLLCSMPWAKSSRESLELDRARAILNEDHYGLDKIKKRIVQHLAVLKLKKKNTGSILLFVGPPGVGKTSLGQSIAKALGRKFVRGSLGGVRDDAEIRGHRRTYIGAMPGRIIQGIKRAGENNPVFMLDEIDKLSHSFHGDPASALLEVLDPEQNATFLDHYLDVPFNLSNVFFIATANTLETIPGPLLDRMEVIDLAGYTTAEKLHIARNHLIPKQLEEFGLTPAQLAISDEALLRIISYHTREAGVRELQRKLAAVCRASTEEILATEAAAPERLPVRIDVAQLEEVLGPERFVHEVAEQAVPPGVTTGLAWTPQGGEILFTEASQMPGTGRIILTGQLGDVMKESAQIAMSLVRSNLASIVQGVEFEKRDIHIHVPAGAIPKDGPSAGVTLLTTLASLLTGRSVDPKLAMTGEITLRGNVMPVGGIKEKVMAAHRAGIERILLAKRNEKDLRDVPEEVKAQLKFHFVESVSEVLKLALDLEVRNLSGALGIRGPAAPPTPAVA